MGRGHHLHPHVGRIRVSGHCSGLLLPEKVVGYAMADNMKTDLICKAIDMAVRRCPHQEEVTIFHSGRGSQYTSQQFAKHLKNYKILPSVGRTGVCWDNAWAQVLQRHPGRTNASTPVVHHHTGKGHQRCCLVDRTDL